MSPSPATRPTDPQPPPEQHTGISNRETPQQEQAERDEHPPVTPDGPPPPEDAAGRVGDVPQDAGTVTDAGGGGQTSHKAGSRSVAQKQADRRYPDRSMPPTRKVAGASGKEPKDD